MLGPRKSPTSAQPGEIALPARGRPTRTYSSHHGRHTPCGTANSRPAIVPPGAHDASELAQRRRRIGDVAQEVRERQGVERRVGERELVGRSLYELDVVGQSASSFGQHLRALVEPDDGASLLPKELAGDRAGSGGDVQHGVRGACFDACDQEAPPARVLTERECRRIAVVCRPERREERPGGDGPCHRAESMLAPCR